jgi:hypothetical protein
MADDNGKNRDLRAGQEHPRTLVFCAGALRVGDWIVACEIVNISVEGANVRATQVLEPVSLVTLSVDPCGDFECDVTWQDGETLGLTFREQGPRTQELYETLLQDPEGANGARDATRVQVLWSGQLRSKETSNDCRIVNVSLGGAKAHVSNPSDIISPVTLAIDRFGEFSCEIVWREGNYLGLKFLDDPQTIEETVGQAVPQIRRNME